MARNLLPSICKTWGDNIVKYVTIGALALGAALMPAAAMAMSPVPTKPGHGGGSSGGTSPTPVPEPATMLILGGGLASLGVARKFGRPKK